MKKNFTIFLLGISAWGFNSCTYLAQTFVRNYSKNPIHIQVKCKSDQPCYMVRPDFVLSKKSILPINQRTYTRTDEKIEIIKGENELRFEIPPGATVYLMPPFFTSRQSAMSIDCKIIENGAVADSIKIHPQFEHEKFRWKGGLLAKNLLYYDYGKSDQ